MNRKITAIQKFGLCAGMTALLLLVLLFGFWAERDVLKQDRSAADSLSFYVQIGGQSRQICSYAQDASHCLVFLPSCVGMDQVIIRTADRAEKVMLDQAVLSDGQTLENYAADTEYSLSSANANAVQIQFMRSDVPTMFVQTLSGNMERVHANKTKKEQMHMFLFDENGETLYQSSGKDYIRGRGNSTWSKEKKPYNLYLNTAANLLGMDASAEWTLLANAFDETNLRNKIVFDFARRVSRDDAFAPDSRWVDLYLNGEYAGLYLLSEKAEHTFQSDASGETVLFSWVLSARNDSFFALDPQTSIEIQVPKPCGASEQNALQNKVLTWQQSLYTNGDWISGMDLDSFARKYLIEEIFFNSDLFNSQNFYWNSAQPDGKLFAGPCWDYDLTLGVNWKNTWSTPESFCAQNPLNKYENWYSALCKKPEFRARVQTMFRTDFLPLLESLPYEIEKRAADISASCAGNALRWKVLFSEKTPDTAVQEMEDFLQRHVAFLRSAWLDGETYCTITLQHPRKYEYISVSPGTVCADLPSPQQLGIEGGAQWYCADTGLPFDPQAVITEDLTLYVPQISRTSDRRMYLVAGSLAVLAVIFAGACAADRLRRKKRRDCG